MGSWKSRICAFFLALALMPGVFEAIENTFHLVTVGHLAHVGSGEHEHSPTDPEHGCTPIFHSCGCHTALAFLLAPIAPNTDLSVVEASSSRCRDALPVGVAPRLDRPPQV